MLLMAAVAGAGMAPVALAQAQRPGRAGDQRVADTLRVGEEAPDFTLKTSDGKREVRLSEFRGKRPVVLVFGSYT